MSVEEEREKRRRLFAQFGAVPGLQPVSGDSGIGGYTEAEILAAWAAGKPWREDETACRYLRDVRGLDLAVIPDEALRVLPDFRTSKPEPPGKPPPPRHCLAFPLTNASGNLIGLQIRRFLKGELDTYNGKVRCCGRRGLFCLGSAKARRVIVVDGQEDALALWQILGSEGRKTMAVWATCGVAFNSAHLPRLRGQRLIYLADAGDEKAARESVEKAIAAKLDMGIAGPIVTEGGETIKDANDALKAGAGAAVLEALDEARFQKRAAVFAASEKELYAQLMGGDRTQFPGYPFEQEGGVIYASEERFGEIERERLCQAFSVVGTLVDASGGNHRRLIEIGGETFAIPLSDLLKRNGMVPALSAIGITFPASGNARMRLLLEAWEGPILEEVTTPGHLRGGGFMLMNGTLIGEPRAGRELLLWRLPIKARPNEFEPRQGGSLEGWKRHVAVPLLTHPQATMALLVALASGLVGPLGLDNRTVFWVGQAANGKSSLLRFAASVLGETSLVVHPAGRMTVPGFRNRASAFCSHPFFLDELDANSYELLEAIAFEFGNGIAPDRVDMVGGGNREAVLWKGLLQATGETPPRAIAKLARKEWSEGQEARVLQLSVRAPTTDELAVPCETWGAEVMANMRDLRRKVDPWLNVHCGYAYPAFIRYAVANLNMLRERFAAFVEEGLAAARFNPAAGDSGNVERLAMDFALFKLAAFVAFESGVFPAEARLADYCAGRAVEAIPFYFMEACLERRGGNAPGEVSRHVKALIAYDAEEAEHMPRIIASPLGAGQVGQLSKDGSVVSKGGVRRRAFVFPPCFDDGERERHHLPGPDEELVYMHASEFERIFEKTDVHQAKIALASLGVLKVREERNGERVVPRYTVKCSKIVREATGLNTAVCYNRRLLLSLKGDL